MMRLVEVAEMEKEKPESIAKCPISLPSLSSSGWVTISHSPSHLNNDHKDDVNIFIRLIRIIQIEIMLMKLTAAPTSAPSPSSLCRGHTWRIWEDIGVLMMMLRVMMI